MYQSLWMNIRIIDKIIQKMIETGLEPATSRLVILRSTIDLHDQFISNIFLCFIILIADSFDWL